MDDHSIKRRSPSGPYRLRRWLATVQQRNGWIRPIRVAAAAAATAGVAMMLGARIIGKVRLFFFLRGRNVIKVINHLIIVMSWVDGVACGGGGGESHMFIDPFFGKT